MITFLPPPLYSIQMISVVSSSWLRYPSPLLEDILSTITSSPLSSTQIFSSLPHPLPLPHQHTCLPLQQTFLDIFPLVWTASLSLHHRSLLWTWEWCPGSWSILQFWTRGEIVLGQTVGRVWRVRVTTVRRRGDQPTPVKNVAKDIQAAATWPDIGRHTSLTRLWRTVHIVLRNTPPQQPWPCTWEHTHKAASVLSVENLFPDPGCCRDTSELTQERSHSPVIFAIKLLQTKATWELTCKHILQTNLSHVESVEKHLLWSLTYPNMKNQVASKMKSPYRKGWNLKTWKPTPPPLLFLHALPPPSCLSPASLPPPHFFHSHKFQKQPFRHWKWQFLQVKTNSAPKLFYLIKFMSLYN